MTVSTQAAVRAWLKAELETAFAAASSVPEVSAGPSHSGDFINRIEIGSCIRRVETLAFVGSLGTGALQESLTFTVIISAYGASDTDDFTDLESSALDMLGIVESVVRSDPTAGGLTFDGRPTGSVTKNDHDADGYGVTVITSTLQFKAQI